MVLLFVINLPLAHRHLFIDLINPTMDVVMDLMMDLTMDLMMDPMME